MSGRPVDPELYLAEVRWVRSMARQLLRDEHAADDVVQDVWLAARRSGPADARRARGWIRSVARKLTLRRRRDEETRRGHEAAAASRGEAPGPETAVERMELQRQLAEAVLALDEPYRTAVILRHLDGLSPGAIARREGISREAARQRIARGIARLRKRLDRDFDGGRAAWSVGLLALLREGGGPGPLGPLIPTAGGVAVASKTVVGIGLTGAAALALFAAAQGPWSAAAHDPVAPEAGADASLAAPEASPTAAADVAPPPAGSDERRSVADAPRPDAGRGWRGRVVDSARRPIAGASARWIHRGGLALFPELEPALSDASGAFTLPPPGAAEELDELRLRIEHERYVPLERAGSAPDEPTLTLLARPVLVGHLLPPAGDALPERARVRAVVLPEGQRDDRSFEAEVDAHGRYELTGLVPGRVESVVVKARGYPKSELAPELELRPEAVEVLDLELDPGAVVEGVVLDAATGEPLADAEVWADGWDWGADALHPTARTDGAGRFRLRGVADDVHVHESGFEYVVLRVWARTERHASARTSLHGRGYDAGRRYEVELRLQPSDGRVAGAVTDADGSPAAGVRVRAVDSGANLQLAFTDEAGHFVFENLRPGSVSLLAWRPLDDLERAAVVAREVPLAAGERVDLRLVLERGAPCRLEGRLTAPDGSPVADVRLEARLIFQGRGLAVNVDEVSALSAADGSYGFAGLPPGRYDVVPRPPHRGDDFCRRPHARRVDLEPGDALRELDFVVGGCATWEGRIAPGDVHPSAYRVHLVDPLSGDTIESTAPDGDGAFRLDELAGHFDLVLYQGDEERSRLRVGPAGASGLVLSR